MAWPIRSQRGMRGRGLYWKNIPRPFSGMDRSTGLLWGSQQPWSSFRFRAGHNMGLTFGLGAFGGHDFGPQPLWGFPKRSEVRNSPGEAHKHCRVAMAFSPTSCQPSLPYLKGQTRVVFDSCQKRCPFCNLSFGFRQATKVGSQGNHECKPRGSHQPVLQVPTASNFHDGYVAIALYPL